MPFLAQRRLIHLLAAEHIDEKVYAKLPEACENTHADLGAATHAYETVHRPLLRLVDVGELMLRDERVGAVRIAEAEDVPVAQLGCCSRRPWSSPATRISSMPASGRATGRTRWS